KNLLCEFSRNRIAAAIGNSLPVFEKRKVHMCKPFLGLVSQQNGKTFFIKICEINPAVHCIAVILCHAVRTACGKQKLSLVAAQAKAVSYKVVVRLIFARK